MVLRTRHNEDGDDRHEDNRWLRYLRLSRAARVWAARSSRDVPGEGRLIALGKAVLGLVAAALLIYLALVGMLFWFQRDFIYPAPKEIPARPAGFEDIRIATADGLTLRAFHRPTRSGLPTLIFFHGNGSDIEGGEYATRALAVQGYGILLPEYRGYGGNPGAPTEQGLYRDGDAAVAWLMTRGVPADRIVAIGNSLGSGVATEMAVRHRFAGLVLVSGFASLPRVTLEHYPFVPAGLLVRDRYDNAAKLASITCPILLLHGTADVVADVSNSRALAQSQPLARLEIVPGVGHELAYLGISQAKILAWLRSGVGKGSPSL
jgi:pimeloyl-ACP methyl ester carboxylesterase